MNLLHETLTSIVDNGHAPEDIAFIGSERSGHSCTWDEFKVLADREYDCESAGQKVATDLVIVFRDGARMWRYECDSSEEWRWHKPFFLPATTKKITSLFADLGWESLAEING